MVREAGFVPDVMRYLLCLRRAWDTPESPRAGDRDEAAGINVRPVVGAGTVFYDTRFTPGGFQVPSPAGRIEGGVSFGQ
jgi:hypothetical protein